MNVDKDLDERMRSSQRRQTEAIEAHLRSRGLDRPPISYDSARLKSGRWVLLAATAAVVAIVAVFIVPWLTASPEVVQTATTESDGESTPASTPVSTTLVPSSTDAPTTASSTSTTSTTVSSINTTSTAATAPATVALASSQATTVCPSGWRAPLEEADTIYLSEQLGWNRKDDLIDEQDAEFYFNTWEPNFPGVVQVEVILADPVLATELRLAQDPITEVSGLIEAEAADQQIRFELEGLGGWKIHSFDEPTLLDRFTLTRSQASANIVEVLVCVEGP